MTNFRDFMESVAEPLYFGCKGDAGHYAWRPSGMTDYKSAESKFLRMHDGQLAPQDNKQGGRAILHHFPEFTILAYWDYKVDSRPGSNSMFLLPGRLSEVEAIAEIKKYFPKIWERSPAVVVKEEEHET